VLRKKKERKFNCRDQKTWDGAVGAFLNNMLYADFADDGNMDEVVSKIEQKLIN
jgi:hypothetical protein